LFQEILGKDALPQKESSSSSSRVRGTLETLRQYVKQGMVQPGQLCSVIRAFMVHRIIGITSYRLVVDSDDDDQLYLEALGDEAGPKGKSLLRRVHKDWFPNTLLYQQATASQQSLPKSVPSVYEVLRVHYEHKNHPCLSIAVQISELPILERAIQDWKPVLVSGSTPPPLAPVVTALDNDDDGIRTPIYTNHGPVQKKQKTESCSPASTNPFSVGIAVYDVFSVANIQMPNAEGKVFLPNATHYGIQLRNRLHQNAAATVYIDGRLQGEFLLQPRETIVLERPVYTNKSFMFLYQHASPSESRIQVRFVPEKRRDYITQLQQSDREERDPSAPDPCPGSTMLGEHNDQSIRSPTRLRFNEAKATVLHVHLLALSSPPQPTVIPLSDCRLLNSSFSIPNS
jgi:hypothetical protein